VPNRCGPTILVLAVLTRIAQVLAIPAVSILIGDLPEGATGRIGITEFRAQ
jgi:hypothetical protein